MEVANNGERHPAELKKQMREDKQRETKIQEQLNKQLNGLSPEEKFNLVYKRLVEAEKENKRLVALHKQYERSNEASRKERENMILEHSKVAMTKSKLEQLCRELQKQNRMIKDESMSKIKEEEEKRKETQAKFQKSLNEIQAVMNENNDKNLQLKEDNMEMAKKFKFILEQYELRDQQMDKMNRQMDLVTQLNEAKLAKCGMEAAAEKEKFLAEKELIITELSKVRRQLNDLQIVEVSLREQVNMYSDKYGEFQESLKKSHNVFVGYKGDMEKMSKKIRTLEKETSTWKSKWEKSNSALLDLASEKQVRDEHIMKTARQLFQLQKLCRTLQNERTAYFGALQHNNIDIPEVVEVACKMPEPEPLPAPIKKEEDRLEIMTKSCSALKQNLAALQGQLNDIAAAEVEEDEATAAKAAAAAAPPPSQGKKARKDKKGKNAQGAQKTTETAVVITPDANGDNLNDKVEVVLTEAPATPEVKGDHLNNKEEPVVTEGSATPEVNGDVDPAATSNPTEATTTEEAKTAPTEVTSSNEEKATVEEVNSAEEKPLAEATEQVQQTEVCAT